MKNRSVLARVLSIIVLLVAVGLVAVTPASGQQIGWYVEGSLGLWILNDAQSKCDDFEKAFAGFNPACSIEDKGAVFDLGGGVRVGEYFELGSRFNWIEEAKLHGTVSAGPFTRTVDLVFKPVNGFEVLGRLRYHFIYFEGGFWRWSADTEQTSVVAVGSTVVETERVIQSDSAWSPLLGVGGHIGLSRHIALRFGYTYKWIDAGTPEQGKIKVDEKLHQLRAHFVIFG